MLFRSAISAFLDWHAGVLKLDGELDYANVGHTTSDINAALSITGSVVQTVRERSTRGAERLMCRTFVVQNCKETQHSPLLAAWCKQ